MAQRARVACVLSDGFEDSEFRIPYDRLRGEGYEVEIIGAEAGRTLEGKQGKEHVRVEKGIAEARPQDYQALFIPGGYSPDHLRIDPRFVEFAKAFDRDRKVVAAVCHGPQLLMTAGLVKGRTLTAWPTIQQDLAMVGARVKDEPVVEDGNWITSRKPDDLQQFSDAIVKRLH
jgi:protease I